MRIGLVQHGASPDKAENLARTMAYAADAHARGVDLLVYPEVFMVRHANDAPQPPADVAEPLDGPFLSAVRKEAAARRMHIVMGVLERKPGETFRAYNTAVLIAPDGGVLAAYRKVHLYDAFNGQESARIVPADAPPPVASTALGRIGLQVCYDIRFPEWSRALTLAGAELIVVPTSWVVGPMKEEHWITLLRARAIENTCWFAAAGQIAPDRIGRSLVIDPMGVITADGGEESGLIVTDVDMDRVRRVREKLPCLEHRRPELYGAVATTGVEVKAGAR